MAADLREGCHGCPGACPILLQCTALCTHGGRSLVPCFARSLVASSLPRRAGVTSVVVLSSTAALGVGVLSTFHHLVS